MRRIKVLSIRLRVIFLGLIFLSLTFTGSSTLYAANQTPVSSPPPQNGYSRITQKDLPKELVSLILTYQPYMNSLFLTKNYSQSYIKKTFPTAQFDDAKKAASYKKPGTKNETYWRFSDKNLVTEIHLHFDLTQHKAPNQEKSLLNQYKDEFSPDNLARVSSGTRTLTIKGKNGRFDFDIFFPVSDLESPVIRSVTIYPVLGI